MKDGLYDFRFIALDTVHHGKVTVRGNLVDGGDPIHAVQGQLSRAGANVLASFDIHRRAFAHATDEERRGYTMKMFGFGTDTEFNVIGLAPLGLIVELHGTWRSALLVDGDDSEPGATKPESD